MTATRDWVHALTEEEAENYRIQLRHVADESWPPRKIGPHAAKQLIATLDELTALRAAAPPSLDAPAEITPIADDDRLHTVLLYLAHTPDRILSDEVDEVIHWLANRELHRRKELS